MKNYLIISFLILSIFFLTCSAPEQNVSNEDFDIDIRVDPTVELFCIIHRLAETHQYTENEFSKYINEIEDHFNSFRDHPTINLAIKLRNEYWINGSAPMALALYLDTPPQLKPRNTLIPPPDDLDARWTTDIIPEFIEAARVFAKDTQFMEFFNSHQELYEQSVQNLYQNLKNEDLLSWFQNYFGYSPEKYTVIIGMQNGYGNYGLKITQKDNTNEYISIIGASSPWWRKAPKFSDYWIIPTVVHEFCHSYINPIVDEYDEKLKKAGKIMYSKIQPKGYISYKFMLYEYLVRACTIRYFYSKKDFKTINRQIKDDKKRGFPAIEGLVNLLEKYEANRNKYTTMSDFIPEIEDYFNTYAEALN